MDSLFQLAESQSIAVDYHRMPHNISASFELEDRYYIGMDYSLLYNGSQERVHLAHELGHCITGSFYNPYAKLDIRAKHEYKANKWAYENLLSYDELTNALQHGFTEVWEIAELFNLPCEFVEKAVAYYQERYQFIA